MKMPLAWRKAVWSKTFSAAVLVSVLIFLFDLFTPREYSPWILYFIPILSLARSVSMGGIYVLRGICTVFTMAELFSGESPVFFQADLINHLFAAVTYWIVAFLIRGQKDLLDGLASARSSLEVKVRARTAELAEANRELESFSYSVSHDLRAPLRTIQGFAQMILKDKGKLFDEETRRHFDVIQENTRYMGGELPRERRHCVLREGQGRRL